MSKRKINKSAIDGQIVSDEEAAANPDTTYSQTVQTGRKTLIETKLARMRQLGAIPLGVITEPEFEEFKRLALEIMDLIGEGE